MTTPLHRDEITDRIQALRTSLTTMQMARLTTMCDLVGEDGRFQLRAALEEGDFPQGDTRAQDAFQDFRHKVNALAEQAGVDLKLVLDSRKTSPDGRYGWFTGDPVEKSLVAYTEKASEQSGVERPVAPEVKELGASRRLRVYVSFHPTTGTTARKAGALIDQLRAVLSLSTDYLFEVQDSRSVGLGEDTTQARDRLSAEADVRVALISPEYLGNHAERRRVLERPGRVVAFAFSAVPDGPVDLHPLRRHDLEQLSRPWDQLTRTAQRAEYVEELRRQIVRVVSRAPHRDSAGTEDDKSVLMELTVRSLREGRRDDSRHLVAAELAEASLQESQLNQSHPASTPPLQAVDRLVSWATDDKPGAPRLCALLGDVGMGKTTTAKLFTQRLLELHQQDPTGPVPLLFDLRDVRVTGLPGAMTLDHILDGLLDARRPAGVPRERLNSQVVRKQLEHGRTVIVFDGLDEVLVHLSPHDRQLFTRQLWRAVTDRSAARMLLTCRTQYFRTIRDEITYFTGETRQGLRGGDYLALLMLPFRDEQVREYLAGNLDRDNEWVDRFLETIAAVHDLPDLARRPITLRLIADQVEFIETAKLAGRTLRSVDIYAEVVDRWISRDQGKHTLTPDHKRLLMEDIAAGLWRSGQNAWSPAQVDDWLLDLLEQRPELRRHYRGHVPDLWTADFRTATFLKREGDTFQFGHRSLFEYFLARYLFRTLSDSAPHDDGFDSLAMSIPSGETLDFLGQSIAGAADKDRTAALDTLRRIARHYRPNASELALAYALHAHQHDYPYQSLTGIHLAGAPLSGWRIESEGRDRMLSMAGADLTAANLRRATFRNVDLTGADLTDADADKAEFHESILRTSSWRGTRAVGTILRHCDIDGVDLSLAQTYRTQLLACTPPPDPGPGLLIAPITHRPDPRPSDDLRLRHFTGHTSLVYAAAWSPDGTHILTAGYGDARIWDATTGEVLHHLTGHTGVVHAVAWSPDGTHILTADNGDARISDATTGEVLHHLNAPASAVYAAAWSPDGARILTAGYGDARIWDATTGELLHHLNEDTDTVQAVAWSPDGTHILTADNVGDARISDATTGGLLHHLTGHTSAVHAAAWSPDGDHILTADSHGDARTWDATTGGLLHHLNDDTGSNKAVAWSPDGTHILTADNVGDARISDATTGGLLHLITDDTGAVSVAAWSPDGARILTAGNGIRIWNATTGETLHHLTAHTGVVQAVAWSPDGARILTAGYGDPRIWDATTGETLHHLNDDPDTVQAVAWSPDGARILTAGYGDPRIWNATTGEVLHHLNDDTDTVSMAAWSPDGARILTAGNGIRIWNATTGETLHHLTAHTGPVFVAAWSPDGARILTAGNGPARILDATTGEVLHHLTTHAEMVQAAAWSPDGSHILTAGYGSSTRIWDATTGKILHHLTGNADWMWAVAWSPDGSHILTAGSSTRIWDATTHEILHHLTGYTDWIRAAAWSPDGSHILTASEDGSAQIWNADTGKAAGLTFALFTGGDIAVYHAATNTVVGCTEDAWRWLGWSTVRDGRIDRLPAETFGELPPLNPPPGPPGPNSRSG